MDDYRLLACMYCGKRFKYVSGAKFKYCSNECRLYGQGMIKQSELEKVAEMYQTMSAKEIADALGYTESAVYSLLRRNNVKKISKSSCVRFDSEIREMLSKRMRNSAIARVLGLGYYAVRGYCRKIRKAEKISRVSKATKSAKRRLQKVPVVKLHGLKKQCNKYAKVAQIEKVNRLALEGYMVKYN